MREVSSSAGARVGRGARLRYSRTGSTVKATRAHCWYGAVAWITVQTESLGSTRMDRELR